MFSYVRIFVDTIDQQKQLNSFCLHFQVDFRVSGWRYSLRRRWVTWIFLTVSLPFSLMFIVLNTNQFLIHLSSFFYSILSYFSMRIVDIHIPPDSTSTVFQETSHYYHQQVDQEGHWIVHQQVHQLVHKQVLQKVHQLNRQHYSLIIKCLECDMIFSVKVIFFLLSPSLSLFVSWLLDVILINISRNFVSFLLYSVKLLHGDSLHSYSGRFCQYGPSGGQSLFPSAGPL